uniref:cytochrome P450 n=1 Tax=Methylorubrum thiocyanatum TaxID=47958 RepID=UPI0035C82088
AQITAPPDRLRHLKSCIARGPRICIGNRFAMIEAVLILTTLVQRFHFVADTNEPVVPIPSMTLRPRKGVRVMVERRETNSPYG